MNKLTKLGKLTRETRNKALYRSHSDGGAAKNCTCSDISGVQTCRTSTYNLATVPASCHTV